MSKERVYRLKPAPIPKPWGGGHLELLTANQNKEKIGEYVLFSDLGQFPVAVEVNGATEPLSRFWPRLRLKHAEIPFMLKILSTAEPISLQNHPADADIEPLGLKGNGKFECWTILESDPDARAYLGLKRAEKKEILSSLDAQENPLSHFNEVKVTAGDVITLNPGLVHSTTGRILFYEIQQKSDHTFRIYDFGRGRQLHLRQAMHCMRDQTPQIGRFDRPLVTEKFRVGYYRVAEDRDFTAAGEEFSVLTWLGHPVTLTCGAKKFELEWGDTLLVLAKERCKITKTAKPSAAKTQGLPMIDMLFEAYV